MLHSRVKLWLLMQPNLDVFVHKALFYAYNVVASGSWPPLLVSTCCNHVSLLQLVSAVVKRVKL
ncbi:unnamed protein product [Brassica oleracea var. botrytis]